MLDLVRYSFTRKSSSNRTKSPRSSKYCWVGCGAKAGRSSSTAPWRTPTPTDLCAIQTVEKIERTQLLALEDKVKAKISHLRMAGGLQRRPVQQVSTGQTREDRDAEVENEARRRRGVDGNGTTVCILKMAMRKKTVTWGCCWRPKQGWE